MSETISLDWIGTTLRAVQAEQRSIRNENALIRSALSEAVTVLLDRIAQFEAQTDTRTDRLEQRMAEAAAKAETAAFMARLEAIDAILDGAKPSDIMLLAAHALASAAPLCCDQHQDEFKADFLRMLADCIAAEQEQEEAAEADENSAAPPRVH